VGERELQYSGLVALSNTFLSQKDSWAKGPNYFFKFPEFAQNLFEIRTIPTGVLRDDSDYLGLIRVSFRIRFRNISAKNCVVT